MLHFKGLRWLVFRRNRYLQWFIKSLNLFLWYENPFEIPGVEFVRKGKRVFLEYLQFTECEKNKFICAFFCLHFRLRSICFQTRNAEQCSYNLTTSSDTFSSHTDNYMYSSLLDCRWTISVNNSSKIRLTFVYFDTERNHDFVSVNLIKKLYSNEQPSVCVVKSVFFFYLDVNRFTMGQLSTLRFF
jgi:hypothetical protein